MKEEVKKAKRIVELDSVLSNTQNKLERIKNKSDYSFDLHIEGDRISKIEFKRVVKKMFIAWIDSDIQRIKKEIKKLSSSTN